MITIQLYPRITKPQSKKGCQLEAHIFTGETVRTKIGTKIKVHLENWDKEIQQAKFKVGGKYTKNEVKEINQSINSELKKIRLIITHHELQNKELTGAAIKNEYLQTVGKRRKKVDDEEKLNKTIISIYKPFSLKYSHRNGHRTTISSFEEYEKEKGRFRLIDISYDFIKKYAEWLEKKNKSDGTIDLRVRMLKAFINKEIKNSFKGIDTSYEGYNYEILEKAIVRLTQDEFNRLIYLENLIPEQQIKVDWFILITAIGGLRISSAKKLTPDSFNKNERTVTFIEHKKKGGTKEVVNPLNLYARKVLNKYDWKMPKLMAEKNYNDGLELIAKNNGYDRIITEDKKVGGKINTITTPLFKYFTSKLSRKTFTSICSDLKIDRVISNAMSHHSNRTGSASDAYRDETDINLLEHKREEMLKWDDMYNKYWKEYKPKPTEREIYDNYVLKHGKTIGDVLSDSNISREDVDLPF
jgi:integrase